MNPETIFQLITSKEIENKEHNEILQALKKSGIVSGTNLSGKKFYYMNIQKTVMKSIGGELALDPGKYQAYLVISEIAIDKLPFIVREAFEESISFTSKTAWIVNNGLGAVDGAWSSYNTIINDWIANYPKDQDVQVQFYNNTCVIDPKKFHYRSEDGSIDSQKYTDSVIRERAERIDWLSKLALGETVLSRSTEKQTSFKVTPL